MAIDTQDAMSYRYLLALLGSLLIMVGAVERGWAWLAVWPRCDLGALAFAAARPGIRVTREQRKFIQMYADLYRSDRGSR